MHCDVEDEQHFLYNAANEKLTLVDMDRIRMYHQWKNGTSAVITTNDTTTTTTISSSKRGRKPHSHERHEDQWHRMRFSHSQVARSGITICSHRKPKPNIGNTRCCVLWGLPLTPIERENWITSLLHTRRYQPFGNSLDPIPSTVLIAFVAVGRHFVCFRLSASPLPSTLWVDSRRCKA